MTTPYAEMFAEAESTSIEVDGEMLSAIVELAIEAPLTFTVSRIESRADRVQGLVIEVVGAELSVGQTRAPRLTLWADTAPEIVTLNVDRPGRFMLRLWNTWRDGGAAHAWVGWAAIRRHDVAGTTTLACRDGHDDGDFHDLVVEVTYGPGQDSGVLTTALQ